MRSKSTDQRGVGTLRVCLVVAVAENGVIGRGGKLPWRLPSDLKMFRRLTLGKPVIMGRKTYESIGKPLAGRPNIVLTRRKDWAAPGVAVAATVDEALALGTSLAANLGVDDIMVIGGAEIFAEVMPKASRIYLTQVHARPEGDTVFAWPDRDEWAEVGREPLDVTPGDEHSSTLIILDRRPPPSA